MIATISTEIVADTPTTRGRIYSEQAIRDLIAKFDPDSPASYGGILNRDDALKFCRNRTHRVRRLYLDGQKRLMVEVEILDEALQEEVRGGKLVARPIVEIPQNQPTSPLLIRRVDVEKRK
ncbi:MAG: hypothetical protein Q8K86_07210 [Candidatus Nanopelagicaceae bacterium]|nr:hypothetical protein [Candidatus Nanopelagicaceae bacterium]